ncbi:hypothetical protein [Micromonospora zhanjiangensis]|uniref:Uncharacterized protein n=1 Tax=Micromonospora zhanjiangensis TaxID=1522057 RepID=A0ABV8KJ76_9ACTN
MNDNRSSRWRPAGAATPARPDRDAELLAALDGADVSEPVRAAIDRVLSECQDTGDYVDALLARYASERDRRPVRPRPAGNTYGGLGRYTLHLTFPAANRAEALDNAASYAEGLSVLRPEVAATVPLLSRADAWNHVEPLFCGMIGPEGDACVGVPGHPGPHRTAGPAGACWTDDGDRAERADDGPDVTTPVESGER